jgi:hypothetical protein
MRGNAKVFAVGIYIAQQRVQSNARRLDRRRRPRIRDGFPPARLARAHADVVTHPSDCREAQRSQRTLWRSPLAWSSSQAKTSLRQ